MGTSYQARAWLTRRTHESQALEQGALLKQFVVSQRRVESKKEKRPSSGNCQAFRKNSMESGLGMFDAMFVTNVFADKMQTVALFLVAAMTQDDAEHTQGYEGAEHDHGGLY